MVSTAQHLIRFAVAAAFSLALALGACSSNSSGIGHSGGSTGAAGTTGGGGTTSAAGSLATSVSSAAAAGGSIASVGSSQPAGGSASAGGAGGTASQSGGSAAGGGSAAEGGSAAIGGSATSGGTTAASGTMAGATATGGSANTGGTAGGIPSAGGTLGGGSAAGGTGSGAGTTGGRTGGSIAAGGNATGGSKATGGSITAGGSSASGGASGGTIAGGTSGAAGDAASFHCVNWADPGDNFQAGVLQPSGLSSSSDTYATVLAKANAILSGFETALSANSIRIPINEPTVTNTAWWTAYKGIIDAAISKNMKVIVAYWYKPGVGTVPDMNEFYAMWQTVVDAYGTNALVYFDVINEPSGYSPAAFINLVVAWMAKFPTVPHNRILVAGNYNDTDVNTQGADSRLAGCLLNIHIYAIGSTDTNPANWTTKLKNAVGPYANRTVVSEYGAPMTSGYDYSGAVNGTAFIAYMQAVTSQIRTSGMGSCYWPGLRNGDWYSITTLKGTGTNLSLSVNSTSGLALIQSAWGM